MNAASEIIVSEDSEQAIIEVTGFDYASAADEVVTVTCACGCTREFEVVASLLENSYGSRVKERYRPRSYYRELPNCLVSGSAGYLYASLRCLNSINE